MFIEDNLFYTKHTYDLRENSKFTGNVATKINECSEHIDGDCIVFVECKIVFYWIILLCVFHSIVYSDPINFIFVYSTSFKAKSIRSSDRAFSVTENHIVDAKAISNNVSERPHR